MFIIKAENIIFVEKNRSRKPVQTEGFCPLRETITSLLIALCSNDVTK
jgi:hypothetical protein